MIVLSVVATFILGAIFKGWVLSVLWEWFVVPLGVPRIGAFWAMGIVLLANMVISVPSGKPWSDRYDVLNSALGAILTGLIALLLGWVFRGFM